jgi:phosphopantothenate synthetase
MDVAHVERLIDEAGEECLPVVSALVEMYGEGLARVVASLPADQVVKLAEDPFVSQLLVLHDLHPVSAENRVREAIAAAGAYAVVLGVEDGVVRLSAPDDSRRQAIEEAIVQAAPDLAGIEFADPAEPLVVLPQVPG